MAFIHLHCHSNYSLLTGAASLSDLIEAARANDAQALALTDSDALYGAIEFYIKAKEAGIKPILGAEVTLEGGFPLILLCQDISGYRHLSHLLTEAHLKAKGEPPYISWELLAKYNENLLCLPSFAKGEIAELLLAGKEAEALQTAGRYQELFNDRLYLEIIFSQDQKCRRLWYKTIKFSEKAGLPLVATNNIHFIRPEDYLIHKALASIRTLTPIALAFPGKYARPEFYFKSEAEMHKHFAELPAALANTVEVATRCHLTLPLGLPSFPNFELPAGETPFSYLWKLAFQGLAERVRPLTSAAIDRLKDELEVIDKLNLAMYFLIVWDIVKFAREGGIPVMGRGSAANSLVAYSLGITVVDPLQHNLYFERFLNLERKDMPDIDLDLCWVRRDEVLEYVYKRYGQEKVAMAATFATLQARSTVRDVARTFGLSPKEATELTSKIPFCAGKGLRQALDLFPESRQIPKDTEPYRSILAISERIADYPRHLSIHCGGVVIGRDPLPDLVPLTWSKKGLVITQYDMKPLEALGLLKIDLLGHRALTVIADTVKQIEEVTGVKLDPWNLPQKDPKTAAMISAGQTLGCFQIESPGMRSLLQMLQAKDTDDLIVALSLIRPGPSSSGMKEKFVRYHRGLEPVKYLHPKLQEVLRETYGIMLYQEDILKVAHAVAGLTLAQADSLRQAMTKKRTPTEMAGNRETFLLGAEKNGVDAATAKEIWKYISNFAQYAYCKAHATTYGQVSYQCCYLKAHYPSFFLASVLTNQAGFYPSAAYISEARRWGVQLLLPDINFSQPGFSADARSIRIGFMQVKGLTQNSLNSTLTARKDGSFLSLTDFLLRVDIGKSEAESLIKCGAFDSFDNTRPELLWKLDLIYEKCQEEKKKFKDGTLFPRGSLSHYLKKAGPSKLVPHLPDYTLGKRLKAEAEILDMFVTGHPLRLLSSALAQEGIITSTYLNRHIHKRVKVAGFMIATRLAPTVKGEQMKFVTLEDLEGLIEVIMFPKIYQRYGAVTLTQGPFLVTGKVENQNGSLNVVAEKVEEIEW